MSQGLPCHMLSGLAAASEPWLATFHRGWVDGQNGTLFPGDFDLWSWTLQLAYEQGRLAVSNVMSCGAVPVWYGERDHAEAVEIAMAEAKRRTGAAIPPSWIQAA